jgi:glycosyltransferase involved in cell wall biosynthesis
MTYPKTIHLWIPSINDKGGIQVYSNFLLDALQTIIPNTKFEVFSKHDTSLSKKIPRSLNTNTCFHESGNVPLQIRTPAYAMQLLGYGFLKKPNLAIVTHLNFSPVAYWLKQIAGIPYWIVAHGDEAWNLQQPNRKIALCNADKILAVSSYTRDRLLKEQNIAPSQISLLPNTFDPSRYQIVPKPPHLLDRYGLNSNQPVILTVSRLDATRPYKGYYPILRALPYIRHHIPDVRYIIVGKGYDRPNIERLIEQLQLQENVILTGFIPDEELPAHYNLCDLFAMPSKGEGFGIVYLEALACGKPALGSSKDGAIDALDRGNLGVLVDPDDEAAIANITIEILQKRYPHPILYQPHSLREQAIQTFGIANFQKTLSELLKNDFQE